MAKIVGVSDDFDTVQKAVDAVRDRFGDHVSAARSQPYYADVTHPQANKGAVVSYLSKTYQIPTEEIVTIGDQSNDVLMFAHSGLSSAMGNASHEVQEAARRVTTSYSNEGFANAVEAVLSLLAQAADRDRAVCGRSGARVGAPPSRWRPSPRGRGHADSAPSRAQLCVRLTGRTDFS